MKNYVFLYYNNGVRKDVSADDVKAEWGKWFAGLGDKLVDADNQFAPGAQAITKEGKMDVKDMPATGYSIVKADSMSDAESLAKDCPLLSEPEAAVCVYETLPM